MRVVFMGTPPAAVPSLRAVAEAFDVVAVYTRPDAPSGRGRKLTASPVKEVALELGIDVVQPKTLRKGACTPQLRELTPDAIAVVAYGMILPADVLGVPRIGCVNVHFSLLPRWRGAAPVERAVIAGDTETGVTTMLMDEGMDTGPILLEGHTEITTEDTTGTLTERLALAGADLLAATLRGVDAGTIEPKPQPPEGATLAPKISPEEGKLDFTEPATGLWRRVRAFDPSPGAFTWIGGSRVKVWRARSVGGDGTPGVVAEVTKNGIDVQTAEGRLRLEEVQPEGKRRMTAAEFVRGRALVPGDSVGTPAQ